MGNECSLALAPDHLSLSMHCLAHTGAAGVLRLPSTPYQVESVLFASPLLLLMDQDTSYPESFLCLDDYNEVKKPKYDCNLLTDWNLTI